MFAIEQTKQSDKFHGKTEETFLKKMVAKD